MRIDAIPVGKNPPDEVNVIIEVPVGGEPIKYELDKEAGTMFVDRFLYTPMRYPGNYGFIPHTLSEDGDPVDVLVANTRPILPGAVLACRPIGVLVMQDEAGGDEKIVAVPIAKISRRWERVAEYTDLPPIGLTPSSSSMRSNSLTIILTPSANGPGLRSASNSAILPYSYTCRKRSNTRAFTRSRSRSASRWCRLTRLS